MVFGENFVLQSRLLNVKNWLILINKIIIMQSGPQLMKRKSCMHFLSRLRVNL